MTPQNRYTPILIIITIVQLLFTSSAFAQAPPVAPLWGDELPPSGSGSKWHPGHYLLLRKDGRATDANIILNEPNIKGVQIRYYWRDLEPAKDKYDFSKILADLRYLEKYGKRLVVQILFKGKNSPPPSYLKTDTEFANAGGNEGGLVYSSDGVQTIPMVWVPVVMDRYIKLFTELGATFNSEPNFEAIGGQETALGISDKSTIPRYSHDAYFTELKRHLSAAKNAFPNTTVLQYANSLGGDNMALMVAHAATLGAGLGGPDVIPNHQTPTIQAILGPPTYIGQIPLGFAVQDPELCGKAGCNLPETLYQYGVNTLKLNYMFWVKMDAKHDTATEKYSFESGILPVINNHKGFINTECPTSIQPCDTR